MPIAQATPNLNAHRTVLRGRNAKLCFSTGRRAMGIRGDPSDAVGPRSPVSEPKAPLRRASAWAQSDSNAHAESRTRVLGLAGRGLCSARAAAGAGVPTPRRARGLEARVLHLRAEPGCWGLRDGAVSIHDRA